MKYLTIVEGLSSSFATFFFPFSCFIVLKQFLCEQKCIAKIKLKCLHIVRREKSKGEALGDDCTSSSSSNQKMNLNDQVLVRSSSGRAIIPLSQLETSASQIVSVGNNNVDNAQNQSAIREIKDNPPQDTRLNIERKHQLIEKYFIRKLESYPEWDDIVDFFIGELIKYASLKSDSNSSEMEKNDELLPRASMKGKPDNVEYKMKSLKTKTSINTNTNTNTNTNANASMNVNASTNINANMNTNLSANANANANANINVNAKRSNMSINTKKMIWYERYETEEALIQQIRRLQALDYNGMKDLFQKACKEEESVDEEEEEEEEHEDDNEEEIENEKEEDMLDQFYLIVTATSAPTHAINKSTTSREDANVYARLLFDVMKDIAIQIIKTRYLMDKYPMIYVPRSFGNVSNEKKKKGGGRFK
ncbi:kelch motif containing protein [Reticulomyxa filosa]|uniref:Kelch motif containing protein n=1 Tax=Reticulomyxa filosa TaxID=46433 RepID=X6ND59_RETFI|nr:kelch motif containing protein [Reticulomyxa filosa]|eukprot:ETO23881.1 kelch motif containing protein [Reticulomyxa filosa]